jgi:hypothetical protein
MVNIFAFLSLLAVAQNYFYPDPKVVDAYEGEVIQMNFILESEQPFLEVEIEKFAEFKGFWKESTIVKQGLVPLLGFGKTKKAIPIQYLLIPLLDSKEYASFPMHIVVKNDDSKLQSVSPVFKIKKLPEIKNVLQKKIFSNAVGNFQWSLMTPQIFFQKKEAFLLRVLLQGRGNFPEITSLPIPFPKGLKLIQQKVYEDVINFTGNKIFEFLVEYQDFEQTSFETHPFIFFNPTLKNYVTLEPLKIELKPLPPKLSEEIPLLKRSETSFLGSLLWLGWIAMILVLIFFIYKAYQFYHLYKQTPRSLRRKQLNLLLKQPPENVFSEVCQIARQNILAKTKAASGLTNHELLSFAKSKLKEREFVYYQRLFQAQNEAFTPQKGLPAALSLLSELKSYI